MAAQEPPKRTPEQEKQVARAREILEEARKATFALPVEEEGRATLLQGIAGAYAEAGDVDSALLTVDALGEGYSQFKGNILTIIAVHQARAGDVDGALRTFDSAEDQGWKSFGMLMVVVRLGRQGYWGPARQLADKIEEEEVRGKALVLLAQGQAARGDATGARLTAEAIPDEAQREKTLRNIERMEPLIAAGGKVETIDTAFPAATLGSPRVRPETAPFQLQLPSTGLLVAGDNSADPVVNRVRELVEAAVEVKDEAAKKAAIEQLQHAAELAASIESPCDRADQLYLVAVAQSELGDFQRARKTTAQLTGQRGGGGLGSLIHLYTVRSVASAQAASGGVDDSLAWAESDANPTLRAAVLLGAAEGILRRLEVEKWPANLPKPPQ
ncbi:MAG TPA: hypothetical protein VNN18_06235 [Candidatus Xenobia bacterium]|nr:hypothetical protein [Candidatus Xenobia bacterium]